MERNVRLGVVTLLAVFVISVLPAVLPQAHAEDLPIICTVIATSPHGVTISINTFTQHQFDGVVAGLTAAGWSLTFSGPC